MATAKKNVLCQLWGISPSSIDEKVATLNSIIGDIPEITLLDYLTKCDLNIEQCINLHFTHSDSVQTPQIPPHDTHSSNHNKHNTNTHTTASSSNHTHVLNHKPRRRRICPRKSTKTIKKKATKPTDADSDSKYQAQYASSNHHKKRKPSTVSVPSQPTTKKRRLSSSNPSDSYAPSDNTNSLSSKQERVSNNDDNKEEIKQNDTKYGIVPALPLNRRWSKLHFGSFTLRFELKNDESIYALHKMSALNKKGKMSMNLMYKGWFKDTKDTLNKVLHTALYEIGDNIDREHLLIQQNTHKFVSKDGNECKQKKNNSSYLYAKNQVYEKTFSVSISKRHVDVHGGLHSIGFGAAFGILRRNKEIYEDQLNTHALLSEYKKNNKNNNCALRLEGLLDFSCKYKFKLSANQRREQRKYGLNVDLYDYQLQAILYMIEEEHHNIGFYRHLYKLGYFDDKQSFFYYSAAFEHLMINQHLPVVHGGFLCEEMGLGKTIEALALVNYSVPKDECSTPDKLIVAETEQRVMFGLFGKIGCGEIVYYKSRATLIIAPVSLVGQWEKECAEKSAKPIRFKRYYSSSRKRDVSEYINLDIVFTTYGIIASENGDNRDKHVLHCIKWHRIILDESHYIKNQNTVTSRSMHKLKAVNKWLLTGTPFGRQIYDIYNQLKFLGIKQDHIDTCLKLPILKKLVNKSFSISRTAIPLLKVMKCLVMRHKKAQEFNNKAIVEMTDKSEDTIYIEFTQQQRVYYDKLYNTAKERYESYKATGNTGRGSISILASLYPARQACSGHIYSKEEIEQELSKAQAKTYHVQQIVNRNAHKSAQELYEMALAAAYNMDDKECPICYETPFDDPLQTVCRHIFCGECIRSVLIEKAECPMCRKKCTIHQLKKPPSQEKLEEQNGNKMDIDDCDDIKDTNQENQDEMIRFDTKLKILIEEINRLKKEKPNDKSLIFTSFCKSLDWICTELTKNGVQYRTLTGSMSMNKRKKALEQFQNDLNVKVFVLTVRSGAVGITLTAANHVFLMEPPFNPALYRQAINRVHRLGQTKKVLIKTLIMKDSIEERIWNINKDKQNDKNKDMAGNIAMDKSTKLQTHEISKLFE